MDSLHEIHAQSSISRGSDGARINHSPMANRHRCLDCFALVVRLRMHQTITTMKYLLLLFLSVSVNAATTYYVDVVTGNDGNAGTSQGTPWKHLPGDANATGTANSTTIAAGDKVIVKGGTTNNARIDVNSSHYSAANSFDSVVIKSGHLDGTNWGTGQAIFDGQNTRTCGIMVDHDGITVDGFEIREIAAGANLPLDSNSGSACIGINASHSTKIARCWLHNAYYSGPSTDKGFGIEFGNNGTNFIITQNHIGPTIQMKGIEPTGYAYGVISNNYLSGIYEHVIALSNGTNIDICNNVIRHDPPYGPQPSWCIAVGDSVRCDVWNNLFFRDPTTSGPNNRFGVALGFYATTISNRFFHNVVAYFDSSNAGSGATAIGLERNYSNKGIEFQNNVIYSNRNDFGPMQYCLGLPATETNIIRYCDFFSTSTIESVMDVDNAGIDTLTTVAAFAPGASAAILANNIQLNPVFAKGTLPSGLDGSWHPNSVYFSLSASAPAAVKSTGNPISGNAVNGYDHSVGKFNLDILGNMRANWSMGAYELLAFPPVVTNVTVRLTGIVRMQ